MKGLCRFGGFLRFASQLAHAQDRGELDDGLDKFAAAHLDEIQARSIAENVEYCGYLGYDAAGRIAATQAKRGLEDSCEPDDPPDGFEIIASYHTHGAYTTDADTEAPSLDDLQGDFEEGIDGYIATPAGRLWLTLVEERLSFQLCGPGCVTADENFRACGAFPPGDEYTLGSLQARADEDTGEC